MALHVLGVNRALASVWLRLLLAPLLIAITISESVRAKPGQTPLVIAVDQSAYPLSFMDDQGDPAGLFVDIWRLWSERTGHPIVFKTNDWAGTLADLRLQRADIHSGLYFSEQRSQWLTFGEPFYGVESRLFYAIDNTSPGGLESLRTRPVGATAGTYQQEYLKGQRLTQVLAFDNSEAMIRALHAGLIEAFLAEGPHTQILLDRLNSSARIEGSQEALFEQQYRPGVLKDRTDLIEKINRGFAQVSTQELAELERIWVSYPGYRYFKEPLIEQNPLNLSDQELSFLAQHPIIQVAGDPNWAPFDFQNTEGRSEGLSVDYLNLLGQALGVNFEQVASEDWSETLGKLKSRRVGAVRAIMRNPQREKLILFTQPYMDAVVSIFTRRNSPSVSLESLAGKTVAVERNYFTHEALNRDHPKIELLLVNTTVEALQAVSNGQADAYVGTLAAGQYMLEQHFITNVDVAGEATIPARGLRIGVRNDWPELRSALDKAIASITPEQHMALRRPWIHQDSKPSPGNLSFTAEEQAFIEQHPIIRFTGDPDWLPFEAFNELGEYEGVVEEVLKHLESTTGLHFERLPSKSWLDAVNMATSRQVDVLSDDLSNAALANTHTFTNAYLERSLAIVMRASQKDLISDLYAIADKRIGVVNGYGYLWALERAYPDITFDTRAKSIEEALNLVANGELDALIVTYTAGSYQINQLGISKVRINGLLPINMRLGLAVRNDWPELTSIINKAIASITPAEKHRIVDQWMEDKYIERINYRLVWQLVAGASAALLVMFAWNTSIQRQKRRLRRSEERFQLAMDATSDGLWDWNIKTGKVYYSPGYLKMLGHTPEEVSDTEDTWISRLHPDDKERAVATLTEAVTQLSQQFSMEFRLRHKNGSYRNIHARGSIVATDKRGRAVRAVGTHRDVTERRQAEENLRVFRRFADSSNQGLCIIRNNGDLGYANPALTRILDLNNPDELVGRRLAEFLVPEKRQAFVEQLTEALEREPYWLGEVDLYTQKGKRVPAIQSVFRIESNDSTEHNIGCIITDISEQRENEKILKDARDLAEQASKFKSEFLANMSHEIRTPLNAIVGMTHLAQQTHLTAKQKDYLTKIELSSEVLLRVINDILDFSRIEAGRLTIEQAEFSLETVFSHLSDVVSMQAAEKGLELIYAPDSNLPDRLIGDPLRLGQVLINLVSNAIKFTELGQVVVTATTQSQQEDYVTLRFSVADSGIGISPDKKTSLFEPFTQADGSTTRRFGGTGLGLSICKNLVTLMGGEIHVDSAPGKGSCFYFTAKFQTTEATTAPHKTLPNLRGTRVLVVDDNQAARETLTGMLQSLAFDVTAVDSGEAALAQLQLNNREQPKEPYQLLLMDWKMPEMDGLETCLRIRQGDWLPHIPAVIMVTAYGREEMIEAAQNANIEGFLVKPVNPSTLFDTIINVLTPSLQNQPEKHLLNKQKIPHLAGFRVLVVEDNAINQQVAEEMLARAGITVAVANNAKKAIERAHQETFDLVLMDLQMPEMDGLEATEILRRDFNPEQLPIIAMTAHAMTGDRERCLASGMNDHLAKPIDPDLLYHTLNTWLAAGKAQLRALTQTNSQELLPENLPGVDIHYGLSRIGGNKTLYKKLLHEFVSDHEQDLKHLTLAIEKKHYEDARRIAHTIRSVSGTLGATQLEQQAESLEQHLARNSSPAEVFEPFSQALAYLLNQLKAYFAEDNKHSSNNALSEEDKHLQQQQIVALKESLHRGDSESRALFQKLKYALQAHLTQNQLSDIENYIEEFEFEQAEHCLTTALTEQEEPL